MIIWVDVGSGVYSSAVTKLKYFSQAAKFQPVSETRSRTVKLMDNKNATNATIAPFKGAL